MTRTAAYGSWKSPITSDLIVAQSIALSEVQLNGEGIYWLEGRPQEQGRFVVVRTGANDSEATDLTPKPYSARTRVHEYGSASWTVDGGTVYFSNFADGRLYRSGAGAAHPEPLTPPPPTRERNWRFATDHDRIRQRWIGVRGSHRRQRSVNTIVAVDLRAGAKAWPCSPAGTISCAPAVAGRKPAARLAWDHPNMPWNGTTLYLADLDQAGNVREPHAIAGGAARSIFSPNGRPTAAASSMSDRSNWWNPTASISPPKAPAAGADGGGIRRTDVEPRGGDLRLCGG
jgi:hypothetical protein